MPKWCIKMVFNVFFWGGILLFRGFFQILSIFFKKCMQNLSVPSLPVIPQDNLTVLINNINKSIQMEEFFKNRFFNFVDVPFRMKAKRTFNHTVLCYFEWTRKNELETWLHTAQTLSWSSLWPCLLALSASLTLIMVLQNIHIPIVQVKPFMRSTKHGLDLVGDQRFIIPAVTNVRVKCYS